MVGPQPLAADGYGAGNFADIVKERWKESAAIELDYGFCIAFDMVPLGAKDERTLAGPRKAPGGREGKLLVVPWKRYPTWRDRGHLGNEPANEWSIRLQTETQLRGIAIPLDRPETLARRSPSRLDGVARCIAAYPGVHVVKLIALGKDG